MSDLPSFLFLALSSLKVDLLKSPRSSTHVCPSRNTKYVNTSTYCLKYTLLLYIQEEDQEERGIVGAHTLLVLIGTCGVIQGSNWWQLVSQRQLKEVFARLVVNL